MLLQENMTPQTLQAQLRQLYDERADYIRAIAGRTLGNGLQAVLQILEEDGQALGAGAPCAFLLPPLPRAPAPERQPRRKTDIEQGGRTMPKAIAICTPVTDYLINLDHIPQPQQLRPLERPILAVWGQRGHGHRHRGRQGLDCGIIAPVGDDDMGRAQEVDFARHGVDTRYLFKRKTRPLPL